MSFELPPFPAHTAAAAHEIGRRHGRTAVRPHMERGTCNEVWALGDDLLLRIPRDHPAFVDMLMRESTAIPAARAAGVRTPDVVESGGAGGLLPVPYLVVERVPGRSLAAAATDPAGRAGVWTELGGDVARLHAGVQDVELLGGAAVEALPDPHHVTDRVTAAGHLHDAEAAWLHDWLGRLEEWTADAGGARVFRHGDSQSSNVVVDPSGPTYRAVVDWGSCGWGDAADDFAGLPMRAVPAMLAGYESVAGRRDVAFLARIVWRQLQIALFLLERGPAPGHSWAERSTAMLVDVLRFFSAAPERWRPFAP